MSDKYKGVVEIVMGDFNQHDCPPGFGHQLHVLAGIIGYCRHNNLYPVLNEENWCYGKWENYFVPFWDENEKQSILASHLHKEVINTNLEHGCGHRWGLNFTYLPYVQPQLQNITLELFKINTKTQQRIQSEIKRFQDIDVAIHIRLGYEGGGPNLATYCVSFEQAFEQHAIDAKRIFILTDTYETIRFFKSVWTDKEILSLCPEEYDGLAQNIRHPDNLLLLLTEIEIAKHAKYFIGRSVSQVPGLISMCRQHKNVLIMRYPSV